MRAIGANQKLVFLPGKMAELSTAMQARAAVSGTLGSRARKPLVRQAQELIQAEVRSVLDCGKVEGASSG